MSTAHAKKFCSTCGHSMALHRTMDVDDGSTAVGCLTCSCSKFTEQQPPAPAIVKAAAIVATSHLRLSIGALRDVEKGEDKTTGTSAAYWRQKLEAIADLLESDLKDLK